ncbi:MAG: type IV toxin-antitoxin system AbiEi family antitoxin [Planctomycetota bacterium]|nr:type IV toxin-antitoxin system AbiEi family antitoxin [Planctomycetota bacterium]MDA1141160.1 type IV toxin-antitoxin system AbiEi family antitoxin [Planctomycetota bacterium]
MASHKHSKINQLLRKWPEGTVGVLDWLKSQGVSRKLADWHVKSGWLDRLGPRAFVRGGDEVDWTGGVYALQKQVGLTVHVGGLAALELQGRAHFVPLGRKCILLVSDRQERLPNWFVNHDWGTTVLHRCMSLFDSPSEQSLTTKSFGRYEVALSSPERAIMEVMEQANENFEIEHALEVMSGLTMLRPSFVQPLLEGCKSIKVKRLFLWSAESGEHPWLPRLNLSKIDLGKGKRSIYKGGRLDKKYGITVPVDEELPNV